MKYYVTFRVEGRYIAAVEADSVEKAIEKANEEYLDADFGLLQDIDGEPIIAEDENENYVWEA